MTTYEPLTDSQWQLLEPLFPTPVKRGRGKPHTPWRSVVNSILFVLTTGAKWSALPKTSDFASKSAAHRWYILFHKNGFIEQMLKTLNGEEHKELSLFTPARRNRVPKVVELAIASI